MPSGKQVFDRTVYGNTGSSGGGGGGQGAIMGSPSQVMAGLKARGEVRSQPRPQARGRRPSPRSSGRKRR